MPRTETIISIFVSSPSDVVAEREILENIVSETNRNWSRSTGIRLNTIRWESDSRPGFASDPQAVLNNQLPEDYDVFIGILWGRIGTPTPRSESGTLEEFERAYKRYKANSDSVELMIYFKDAGIPPSQMDPIQVAEVLKFKNSLGSKGGLYSTFTDDASFEDSLRAHLASLASKFTRPDSNNRLGTESTIVAFSNETALSVELDDEDELGLLDYIETYEIEMAAMTTSVEVMSEATETIGNQLHHHAVDISKLPESERTGRQGRRIVRLSAEDLERFSFVLKSQLPVLAKSRRSAFDALNSALVHHREPNDDDVESLSDIKAGLSAFHNAVSGCLEGIVSFRETVYGLPKLSAQLNRAKRSTTDQLGQLIEEINATASTAENVIESLGRINPRRVQ